MMSDRFRDLSLSEQRLESARRDGGDPVPTDLGRGKHWVVEAQEQRPDRFIRKLYRRPGGNPIISTRANPASDASVGDWQEVHAAGEFCDFSGLTLDTHVTIHFGKLGITAIDDVETELRRFVKNYGAWCRPTGIPALWMSGIEQGSKGDYHAHVPLYVPPAWLNVKGERPRFRLWANEYDLRHYGRHVPRAIRVNCGLRRDRLRHWKVVMYLLKGYDRDAIIRSARNSVDGRVLMLGDLSPWPYIDPGHVPLKQRLKVSRSLGPAQRAYGVPPDCETFLPAAPNLTDLFADVSQMDYHQRSLRETPLRVPTPFRSTFEDGLRDVRQLFPPEFYRHVTKLDPPRRLPRSIGHLRDFRLGSWSVRDPGNIASSQWLAAGVGFDECQ